MKRDHQVLRSLALETMCAAQEPVNEERRCLYRAVNDLHMVRPVVLLDEIPWHELEEHEDLVLRCEDEALRKVELRLRRRLFQYRYFPGDMIMQPYFGVEKRISGMWLGIPVQEKTLAVDARNRIISHEYHDQLQNEEDLEILALPEVRYDEAGTMAEYSRLGEIFGDLLPLRLCGIGYVSVHPWDDLARLRGVTNLLMDLAERPEFMHRIVRRYMEMERSRLEQCEALGLLDPFANQVHCTPALSSALPSEGADGQAFTRKDVWGRGMAQIFGAVSKAMHDEFDIEYMKDAIGGCGLTYYGCCEPLHDKIDIVERIPNLRKISITPWADVDVAAERIGKRYVLSNKPNPAAVAVPRLDEEALRQELGRILGAVKRHGCACDITLKDISTCNGRLENLVTWEKMAMDMVSAW